MKYKYYFKTTLLCFIVTVPLLLLLLPANFFDNGQSICLSQILLGKECFACGISRGIMHLIHLDFENAFAYNMLSFIVLPLLSIIWVQWFLKQCKICIFWREKLYLKKKVRIEIQNKLLIKK